MKVAELIEILQEMDESLEVVLGNQQEDEPEVLCMLDAETDEEYVLLR